MSPMVGTQEGGNVMVAESVPVVPVAVDCKTAADVTAVAPLFTLFKVVFGLVNANVTLSLEMLRTAQAFFRVTSTVVAMEK